MSSIPMAGSSIDITSFLPGDDADKYKDVIDAIQGADTKRLIAGLGAQAGFNNAVSSSVANVQNMFLKGEQEKSKANMQASNILGKAKMNAPPKQEEPSTIDKILGYGTQALGIASGLGAFSGGGSSFGNDGFGSFGDYSGIPSDGWGIFK